ncbi:HAD family hydrolase [Thermaurantiacus sp.]
MIPLEGEGPRPRAVVFDVGHVLYDWDPAHLYRKLIADEAERAWFLREVVTREWHFQHDAGRAFSDTSAELIARFPDQRDRILAYGARWLETIPGPVPGTLDLAAELARGGVPLFAITNFSSEFWDMFRPTAPVFDLFADVIVSGRERLTKPAPEIFRLALSRFGLAPGEALFIDDQPGNVAAAVREGFVGHVFTSAAALRAELRALSFPVAVAEPAATA